MVSRASSREISRTGIGDVFDDFSNREHIDFTGFRIDAAAQFFVGLEVLARSDDDRVLDRMDHDLRIDAFLPADLVDRLKKQIRHPSYSFGSASPRPVELQPGFLYNVQRNFQQIALRQFQDDTSVAKTFEPSLENFLMLERDSCLNLGQLSIKASVVPFLDQLPIQTW